MKVNGNELAKLVAEMEGKKVSISIAQVKEVIRILSRLCYRHPEVIAWLIMKGDKLK